MRFFIILALFIAACGQQPKETPEDVPATNHFCEDADEFLRNACIITNGYDVDMDMLYDVMQLVESKLNAHFNNQPHLDIDEMLMAEEVSIAFEEKLPNNDRGNTKPYYCTDKREEFCFAHIRIRWEGDCNLTYYVLAHELMHVAAEYKYGVTHEENMAHDWEPFLNSCGEGDLECAYGSLEYEVFSEIMSMDKKCEG